MSVTVQVQPTWLDETAERLGGRPGDVAVRIARAIAEDLCDGVGGVESIELAELLGSTLPGGIFALQNRSAILGARLGAAAGAYRRADVIARVAAGGR